MSIKTAARGHLSKKELKQDKLVEWTYKFENYYNHNRNLVIGVAVAIVVVVVGGLLISRSLESAKVEQSYELSMAKSAYGSGNIDQAKQSFEAVVSKFSGTAAGEANYFLGRIAFDQGDFAGAGTRFETYLKDYSVDRYMDASAWAGLAAVREAQGSSAEAAQTYERIAKDYMDLPYAPQALADAGRLYLKLNQKDKAIAALKTLREKYPDSALAVQAKKDLDNLQ
jgi:TolA-binding protein